MVWTSRQDRPFPSPHQSVQHRYMASGCRCCSISAEPPKRRLDCWPKFYLDLPVPGTGDRTHLPCGVPTWRWQSINKICITGSHKNFWFKSRVLYHKAIYSLHLKNIFFFFQFLRNRTFFFKLLLNHKLCMNNRNHQYAQPANSLAVGNTAMEIAITTAVVPLSWWPASHLRVPATDKPVLLRSASGWRRGGAHALLSASHVHTIPIGAVTSCSAPVGKYAFKGHTRNWHLKSAALSRPIDRELTFLRAFHFRFHGNCYSPPVPRTLQNR